MAYTKYLKLPNRRANAGDRDHLQHIEEGIVGLEKATYDLWPTGSAATDIPALTAAASRISGEGGQVIRLAPGHYDFTDITPDDILGLYIVGDNVTVTPTSFIYPFSSAESIQASATRLNTGGRGRIAIELDDGLTSHWTELFPLTKELGIPMASAWHTGNGAKWLKEAYRHGWEILSHLPENITATTYLANGQLDAVAKESYDAVKAITGQDRIGFVYPQHVRSAETDRILSKYYSYGRGLGEMRTFPRGVPSPWLTAAYFLDPHFSTSGVSATVKNILRTVADADLRMVFYMHYQSSYGAQQIAGLRDFVATCRRLGIEITTPSQIYGVQSLVSDPYFEDTSRWTLGSGMGWDTATRYHGSRSARFTPSESENSHASIAQASGAGMAIPSIPGHFTVLRASIRRKHDAPLSISAPGQGMRFTIAETTRNLDGTTSVAPATNASINFPTSGTVLAASPDWTRTSSLIHVAPDVMHATLAMRLNNALPGSPEVWFDEMKVEVVDYVAAATVRGTLAGTGEVRIYTSIPNGSRHISQVMTDTPPEGRISVTWSGNLAKITSTSANDTMGFTLRVMPGASFQGDVLPDTGA